MKKRNYLQSFNLFNKNAGKQNSNCPYLKSEKNVKNKILELHFINPNILFMDSIKPDPISRAKTAEFGKTQQNNR